MLAAEKAKDEEKYSQVIDGNINYHVNYSL
jgi:hypothetical protein